MLGDDARDALTVDELLPGPGESEALPREVEQRVLDVMTTELVTVTEGVSADQSRDLLHKHRIEKLVVVDGHGRMKGLITIKDIEKAESHPQAVKDEHGRLRVGAAVGIG